MLTITYLQIKLVCPGKWNREMLWSADRREESAQTLTSAHLRHGAGANPSSSLRIPPRSAHLLQVFSLPGEQGRQTPSSRSQHICICHSASMFSYYRADKVTAIINLTVYRADWYQAELNYCNQVILLQMCEVLQFIKFCRHTIWFCITRENNTDKIAESQ